MIIINIYINNIYIITIFIYISCGYERWVAGIFWYGKDLEMKHVYNIMPADNSELLGDKLEE